MITTETFTLASYAAGTAYAALPAEVAERTKKIVSDEVACAYFARRSLAGALAARYSALAGGLPEARIYATGERVSAAHAALANGAAGHGEEVDGAHVVGGHPGASIVHACMAIAERQRSTGAELVNAVALGYDIGVRVVEACGGVYTVKSRFGMASDFLYALGCAAGAGRLLKLDPSLHCHALALTTFASNSLCALFAEKRHISKSLCNGQFAMAGIQGALMAASGLEGHEDILGAPFGVFHAWGLEGRRDALTHGLGADFKVTGANFKFINAGYPIHTAVEAAMQLVARHRLSLESIASISIGMPTKSLKVVDSRDMHNICVQDMVTAALVQGKTNLRELPFPSILENPEFKLLHARVTAHGAPELDRDQPDGRGAIVRIATNAGQVHAMRIDNPKGHSKRGDVTWDELAEKWEEMLPGANIARMVGLARQLDRLDHMHEFLDAFCP